MVLHETARFHFRMCSCGSFKRGEDYKKHIRKQSEEEKKDHTIVKFLIGCIPCLKFKRDSTESATFFQKHRECKSGLITNAAFRIDFMKFRPEIEELTSEEEAERELLLAIEEIATPAPLPPPPSQSEILPQLSDTESSDDETVPAPVETAPAPPQTAPLSPIRSSSPVPPPPRGIHHQTAAWNKDDEVARVTQRKEYLRMQNSVATLRKTNKELLGENKDLRERAEKVTHLQQEVQKLEHFRKRALTSETRVAELTEKLRKIEKEKELLATEKAKLEVSLQQEQVKKLQQRRTTLHVPMVDNSVVDAVLMEDDDSNKTFSCYEGTHSLLECVHLTFLHEGDFAFVRHRKKKRAMPSKSLKTK